MLSWKQEIPWLFDVERRKKAADGENVVIKALAKKKLFMTKLLSNGLHEKVIICYIITLYY